MKKNPVISITCSTEVAKTNLKTRTDHQKWMIIER